jgi:hypothetical protein
LHGLDPPPPNPPTQHPNPTNQNAPPEKNEKKPTNISSNISKKYQKKVLKH